MAQTFDCPSCGAPLEIDGIETTIHCEYCGETVIVPPGLHLAVPPLAEGIPSVLPESSQVAGTHGMMSPSQMRQMMMYIRSGQLEDAARTFQAGTGVNEEMSRRTVQMIADHISGSNLILPAEMAVFTSQNAQSTYSSNQPSQPAAASPPRRGGIGCWLPLLIILLVIYFVYTSLSPVNLATALLAGNANDPVLKTAVAPFYQIATALAPVLH